MKTLTPEQIKSIRQNPNKQNWYSLSRDYKLPADFVREFKDKVDWHFISYFQILSEDFIREFQNEVEWLCISMCQNLSEEFFLEFKHKLFNEKYFTECYYIKNYNNVKHFLKYGMKLDNHSRNILIS
ncbi:hypothetical protein KY334_07060 [Candidatus Woesearchaeota archaeon]|nr:hypothetical protein [Candidatus Woesearchaeota archaeon]